MRAPLTFLMTINLALQLTNVAAQTHPTAVGASQTAASSGMTNADVIRMVKVGLGEPVVIAFLEQPQPQVRKFDLSVNGLVALKVGGVSDTIIAAMMKSVGTTGLISSAAASPTPVLSNNSPSIVNPGLELPATLEIGAYYERNGAWNELSPEVVNWSTGGLLKHVASMGMVGGDLNGIIAGPISRASVKPRSEILIRTPEGVAITEYQLLWLREHSKSREFRTVTGGILHASSGTERDLVSFESKKVAPRTYKVLLPDLEPGEYGILPPGAMTSTSASAQLGKIYTFHIE